MEPIARADVISDSGFVHQIKWDGIRGVTIIEQGGMKIYTRRGIECTASYPELEELPKQIRAKQAVLDGELVVFEKDTPSFLLSLKRNRTQSANAILRIVGRYPVKYIVFDMLFLDGEDMRQFPLAQRQSILKEKFSQNRVSALTENFEDGQALYDLVKSKNMEGIVSKRLGSVYTAGKKHSDWYKTKTAKKMLCAVIGVYLKNNLPASLVLGVHRDGDLVSIGKVSSGLSQNDLMMLGDLANAQSKGRDKSIVWLDSTLTCWVRFSEWTHSGTLRHPVLIGFSNEDAVSAAGGEISV